MEKMRRILKIGLIFIKLSSTYPEDKYTVLAKQTALSAGQRFIRWIALSTLQTTGERLIIKFIWLRVTLKGLSMNTNLCSLNQ